jgi:hypothetical protein
MMHPIFSNRAARQGFIAGVAGLSLLLAVAAFGYWLGSSRPTPYPFPELNRVSTAASGSNLAVATGLISEEAEGIFFLDFTTGDLQCLVYYPRSGAFGARYFTNINAHLPGGGRNSNYLMVTGTAMGARGSTNVRPGNCLVYVTDVSSGTFAAYAIPWNRSAENSGQPQVGAMRYVGGGPIRNFQIANVGGNVGPNAGANNPPANNPPANNAGANNAGANNAAGNNAAGNNAAGNNAAGNNAGLNNGGLNGINNPPGNNPGGNNAAGNNAAGNNAAGNNAQGGRAAGGGRPPR